jgi:hypothetical protein
VNLRSAPEFQYGWLEQRKPNMTAAKLFDFEIALQQRLSAASCGVSTLA